MKLIRDGQVIELDNENHINAFLSSGWAEAKASASTPKEEVPKEEVVEKKKPVAKKKQEK